MVFTAIPTWNDTLANIIVVHSISTIVPSSMDLNEAAVAEPLFVAIEIANSANLHAYQTVMVLSYRLISIPC